MEPKVPSQNRRNPYAPPSARLLELPNSAQTWGRVGLLVPSFGTACVVAVGLSIAGAMNSGWRSGTLLGTIIGLFVAYWFAVALAFVVGLLFRYLAQHRDLGRAWVAVMMGTVVGGLSAFVIDVTMRRIPELSPVKVPLIAYLQFGVIGAIAGFVFWQLANRRLRPTTSLERTRGG